MGASSASCPRSERTMISYPSAMHSEALKRRSSSALRSPAPPSFARKRMGSVIALSPFEACPPSRPRIFSSSSLRSTGVGSESCRHASGPGSRRLPSGPTAVSTAMMISSRMASTGGFVTCAKSCLK